MKEIVESFLGILFLILIMTSSVACISASIEARNADAEKTGYVVELENSNFADSVIKSVFDDAQAKGYYIDMTLYRKVDTGYETSRVTNMDLDNDTDASSSIASPLAYATVTTGSESTDDPHKIGDTTGVYMVRMEMKFHYSFPLLDSITTNTLVAYAR